MASLTRSASLTDLSGKHEGTAFDGVNPTGYGSPQKNTRTRTARTASVNLYGNSAALNNWKWLSSSKSFHESQIPGPQIDTTRFSKQKVVRPRYLDHLETLLPQYCKLLSHPSYQEAASAMNLLINSPPPAPFMDRSCSNTTDYSPGSPEWKARLPNRRMDKEEDSNVSVTSEMNRILSSPFRKKKPQKNKLQEKLNPRRWGSTISSGGLSRNSSSRTQPSTQSADTSGTTKATASAISNKLDEAAWQEFVSPFILLAGAEAIYADLEHVHPCPTIIRWAGMYERISSEILSMLPQEERESLILSSKPQENTTPVPQSEMLSTLQQTPPHSPHMGSSPTFSSRSATISPLFPGLRAAVASGDIAPTTPPRTNISTILATARDAKTKYKCLHSLYRWLNFKCQWLPFHESLYLTWSLDNLVFLRAFSAALPPLPQPTAESPEDVSETPTTTEGGNDSSRPLMEAIQQEIQTTLSLMEMAFSLERGRFLETIVSARKVKTQLERMIHKETALVLWMVTTFQDYLSVLPLVFDRINAFATPLYGFDQQILLEATQKERTFLNDRKGVVDLDALVLDFLRRQEKAGGTSMAVCLVLDTDGLEDDEEEGQAPSANATQQTRPSRNKCHHKVELGFALHQPPKHLSGGKTSPSPHTMNQPQQQDGSNKPGTSSDGTESASGTADPKQWPAIYLRSTIRLTSQTRAGAGGGTGLGLISEMQRTGSGNTRGGIESAHQGSGIATNSSKASWSSRDRMSPRSKNRKSPSSTSKRSLLFPLLYEPESSSRPSWPHSEWPQLRAFLETMNTGTDKANIVSDNALNSSIHSTEARAMLEEPLAVTFHPEGVESTGEGTTSAIFESTGSVSIFSSDLSKQLWDPLPTSALSIGGGPASSHAPTTFHAVHLSNYMWMIVMVKGEEESRWHRRKARGLPDHEIRAFLNEMASRLRISNRFVGLKTCQTARVKVKDSLAPRVRGRDLGLRDAQWQSANAEDDDQVQEEVLQLLKEAFSVASISPLMNRAESILTTMSGGFRTGASRSPRDRRRNLALQRMTGPYAQISDYREGAALLFFGPELYRQFLEATHE